LVVSSPRKMGKKGEKKRETRNGKGKGKGSGYRGRKIDNYDSLPQEKCGEFLQVKGEREH
jgi:hypothetical protein